MGVVINTFNQEKDKLSHNNLLTELQHEYCDVSINCYSCVPQKQSKDTGDKFRDMCRKIETNQNFQAFIFGCIVGNTVVLGLSWYGQAKSFTEVLEYINYFFTAVYSIEMIIKLISQKRDYFNDGWNVFDFVIVLSAWFGIVALTLFNFEIGPIATIVRSFRIARVLKLIKRARNL